MATATKQNSIFIRIEPDEKKELEDVCSKIGVTPATAAKIFYKQLVKDRAFPFTPTADATLPWSMQSHTKNEIIDALVEAEKSSLKGESYSQKDFDKFLKLLTNGKI